MYVEKFQGIIEDFEYNFSRKYKIKYDRKSEELRVSKKKDSDNFRFFGDKIENISAIIGKNGAGKSSILRVLSMKHTSKTERGTINLKKRNDNYILVYHVRGNIFYIEAFGEDLYKVNKKYIGYNNYRVNPYLECIHVMISNNKFIPIEDMSNKDIKETCVLASLNTVVNQGGSSHDENIIARIGLNEGWEYQYRFLTYAKGNKYDAYKNDISIELFNNSRYEFRESLMNINDTLFENDIRKFSNKERFILSLIYQQIKRISIEVINQYKNPENQKKIEIYLKKLNDYISSNIYENSINYAKEIYKDIISHINDPIYTNVNKAENVQYLMHIIDSLNNLDEDQFIDNHLSVKISGTEDINLVKFFNAVDRGTLRAYSDIMNTLDIKIKYLSDGEFEFMKLFASIYSKIGNYKNIILVLDEPDKRFHPEWSRRFITYLIENLEIFDTDKIKRKYQIILTTHSPFIASDLPKENILMIEDCKIKDVDLGNTFGANIHTLLSKQFFMKSTIGEFAKKKINDCITELNKAIKYPEYKIDDKKKNEIDYIIKNVGEPIIKNKLSKMYKEVFPSNEEEYRYKIKMLEEEKYKLENLLKEKKLDNIDEVMDLLKSHIYKLKEKAEKANDSNKINK